MNFCVGISLNSFERQTFALADKQIKKLRLK